MNSLNFISSDFVIWSNDELEDLSGLNNLNSIGGELKIIANYSLTNLSGVGNISANSISDLWISHNTLLSDCEVQSVCEYITSPNGYLDISNNAPGRNSSGEEIDSCSLTIIDESVPYKGFTISPNPVISTTK